MDLLGCRRRVQPRGPYLELPLGAADHRGDQWPPWGHWLWGADQLTSVSGSQQVPQKSEAILDGKLDTKVPSSAGQGPQL